MYPQRAAFRSKRTSSLHTSENELLITDDKDAGSKLLVHNTKGESGEVHENQVTTVDPGMYTNQQLLLNRYTELYILRLSSIRDLHTYLCTHMYDSAYFGV